MTWLLFAIGAPLLWSIVNIADQYLVEKYANGRLTSGALTLFSSLIGIFVAIFIYIFVENVFEISLFDKLILILTGVFTIGWIILYLVSLQREKISAIVPYFMTVPIFGYIFGYIFLGETITLTQFTGSVIILLGVAILSFDYSIGKRHFKWKTFFYMMLACLMISLIGIIFKYVAITESFWISSFWVYLGLGLTGLLIYFLVPTYRRGFLSMLKKGGIKILSINFASEVLSIIGNLLSAYAVLLAPIFLVYLFESLQPGILLILTLICTKFFPKIIKEDLSQRVLIPKIIAIVIVIIGSILAL